MYQNRIDPFEQARKQQKDAAKAENLMRQLIEERGIKVMDDGHAPVKELTAGLIQECMHDGSAEERRSEAYQEAPFMV